MLQNVSKAVHKQQTLKSLIEKASQMEELKYTWYKGKIYQAVLWTATQHEVNGKATLLTFFLNKIVLEKLVGTEVKTWYITIQKATSVVDGLMLKYSCQRKKVDRNFLFLIFG